MSLSVNDSRTPVDDETAVAPAEADPAEADARPGHRWGTAALALAIVVGMLLGYPAGWLTPQVTRPGDNSAEAGFARDMSTHHAQAVELGLEAFAHASNLGVRTMGVDIATAQQGELGMMQTWLRLWGLGPTGSQPAMAWMPEGTASLTNGLMPGMATPAEMEQLRTAKGVAVDRLFLTLMIKHHLGGLHMLDAVLDKTGNAEVTRAAQRMKTTQQSELNELRQLQQTVGG